jgi:hypothetical protein
MALPVFQSLRDCFYDNKVKNVPKNIFDLLTPVGLAFWIMDDDSKHGVGGLHLNTYGFSLSEVELLLTVLNQKFGLKSTIGRKNHQYRIYISKKSMDFLVELVHPYMHHSMLYKLEV